MFTNKVSPSKIKVYDECKLKYKFKYVDYLPEDYNQNVSKDALQFGSYIHKIFEDGVNCTTLEELKEIAADLRENYQFNKSKESLIDKCLENFLKFNLQLSENVSTEQLFAIEIKDGYAINGIIDRVVKGKTGKYLVIDYKTSKKPLTKRQLFVDPQMMIYAYAVSRLYKVPIKDITIAHYYPHLDKLVSLTFQEAQILMYLKKLTQKVWEIRKRKKSDFFPQSNQFCDWCGYKDLCPLFGGSEQALNEALKAKRKNKPKVPLGKKP